MNKKAIFFDLDNTIYLVAAIGEKLFSPLFDLIADNGEYTGDLKALKELALRKPFQHIAEKFQMSDSLKEKSLQLLSELTYQESMEVFPDYHQIRELPQRKYLITAGFTKLQFSKIHALGIENDFDDIYIVDHLLIDKTKKMVFQDIITMNGYAQKDVLVVGDDPESEIKAASELGIDAVLYDGLNLFQNSKYFPRITDFKDLIIYL